MGRAWAEFGESLGRVWGGFGEDLGRVWGEFGESLERVWGRFRESVWVCGLGWEMPPMRRGPRPAPVSVFTTRVCGVARRRARAPPRADEDFRWEAARGGGCGGTVSPRLIDLFGPLARDITYYRTVFNLI